MKGFSGFRAKPAGTAEKRAPVRKLAWVTGGFSAAIFLFVYLLSVKWGILCALLCVLGLGISLFFWKRKGKSLAAPLLFAGAAAALFWCVGYETLICVPAEQLAGQTLRLTAEVTAWPEQTDYGVSAAAKWRRADGTDLRIVLYLDEEYASLVPGDRVSAVVKLSDAGVVAGAFRDTYYAQGIRLKGVCYGEIKVSSPGHTPLKYVPQLIVQQVEKGIYNAFSQKTAPIVNAMVSGDKTGLSEEWYGAVKRVGLAHLTAVSGMHLAYLVGLIQVLSRRRRRGAVASLVVVVLFVLSVGGTPSGIRAAVMQGLLLLAPLLDRDYDPVTALLLALAGILAVNPYAASGVGVQLSFGAVLGIQLLGRPLYRFLCEKAGAAQRGKTVAARWKNKVLRAVCSAFSMAVGAMAFTVPLSALHFGSIAPLAPLLSVLASLPAAVVFFFGLLAGIVGGFLPMAGMVIGLPAAGCVWYLDKLIFFFSDRMPLSSVQVSGFYMVAWLLFAYAVLLLNLLWKGRGKRRPVLSAAAIIAGLILAVVLNGATFSLGDLTVSALDVGQGQSILLREGSYWVLVDCGGNKQENAGDIAADQLETLGHRRLDALVLTHYHADHANGIPRLLKRIPVDVLYLPDVEEEDPLRVEILQLAEEYGVTVRFVREDTQLQIGPELTMNLYPPLGSETTNEMGLTVLATSGDFDTLITGDMNTEVEQLLLRHTDLPDIELLIVGHHGSRYATSEELLEETRPEWAVISVGHNNYGHPTQDVLDRLRNAGAEVYRTDLQGTVTLHAKDAA